MTEPKAQLCTNQIGGGGAENAGPENARLENVE